MMNYPHDYDRCPGPSKCNHPDHEKIRELESELAEWKSVVIEKDDILDRVKDYPELKARAKKAESANTKMVNIIHSMGNVKAALEARVAELEIGICNAEEEIAYGFYDEASRTLTPLKEGIIGRIKAREREAEMDG